MEIQLNEFNKKIQGQDVLKNINLTLESGKIYSFVGKNGSGKSMLLRAISGLIVSTSGSVAIDGQLLGQDLSFPPDTGILIDTPKYLNNLSGFDNLQFIASIKKQITDNDIKKWMNVFSLPINKMVFRKYSAGMKQKVGIIQALMEEPKLLLLDEPFNALDEESVTILRDILLELKKRNVLIVITSHNMQDHELLSDEIIGIKEGMLEI